MDHATGTICLCNRKSALDMKTALCDMRNALSSMEVEDALCHLGALCVMKSALCNMKSGLVVIVAVVV